MVEKRVKFDRFGPISGQTWEIANLSPKFEFGGATQNWLKNVLNSIVLDQFLSPNQPGAPNPGELDQEDFLYEYAQ